MRRPRLLDPIPGGVSAEMRRMGVDPAGIGIMEEKGRNLLIRLDDLDIRAALVLKQDMLSLGGEAALRREAAGLKVKTTPVLLMGTRLQIRRLVEKLGNQPFGLSDLAGPLTVLLRAATERARFVVKGEDILQEGKTLVMGILNVTDDSFFDRGRYSERDSAVFRGLEMVEQGAEIIDVGGESTRPGAKQVDEEREAGRVLPVIRELARKGVPYISVDTTRASIAEKSIQAGASIINDISGMNFESEIRHVASKGGASVVLMHTKGRPQTMQENVHYEDLLSEVCTSLERSMDDAISAGIEPERICLDPGIGFGKSPEQNLELITRLGEIRSMGTAVMIGASRKSFIGHYSGAAVDDRLPGSLAAVVASALKGADIVRVHDITETVQALAVADGIRSAATR
jgi:dihydropteroate synthase